MKPLLSMTLLAAAVLLSHGTAAAGGADPPPLEQADLQRCLDGEAAQREREAAHEARVVAHRTALGEIADEAGRLQSDRRTLDRTQPGAAAAFNARLDAHQARLARHNEQAQALNAAAQALREARTVLAAGCDGRAHSLTHEAQLRQRGRAAPGAPGSAPAR